MLQRTRQDPPRARAVALALSAASAAVVALSLVVPAVAEQVVDFPPEAPLRRFTDVASEANLPTWWNVVLLTVGACLHAVAAAAAPGAAARRAWTATALLLALLGLDDAASVHEQLDPLGRRLGGEALAFAWVVPGAVAGALLLLLVLRAARSLPSSSAPWLLAGTALLLGSGLGLETAAGLLLTSDVDRRAFVLMTHVEELGEALGAVLLLAAPLRCLAVARREGALAVRYAG